MNVYCYLNWQFASKIIPQRWPQNLDFSITVFHIPHPNCIFFFSMKHVLWILIGISQLPVITTNVLGKKF